MIEKPPRIGVDTNIFVSAAFGPYSVPHRALFHAFSSGMVLTSTEVWQELNVVLRRSKFDRFIRLEQRQEYLASCLAFLKFIHVEPEIAAVSEVCREPDDNKFLALALAGRASLILTGDTDLLSSIHGVASRSSLHLIISTSLRETCVSALRRLASSDECYRRSFRSHRVCIAFL